MNDELRKLQLCELEILKKFAGICKEHDLRYFLTSGSLLGAVRHQGFIPWDDDIDVVMPEKDYLRFLEIQKELPETMEVLCWQDSTNYEYLPAKIRCCDFQEACIDVFCLVPSRPPRLFVRLCFNASLVISYVLHTRQNEKILQPYKNLWASVASAILCVIPVTWLRLFRSQLLKLIRAEKETNTLASLGGFYKAEKEFYPLEWFSDHVELLFEDELFYAPKQWDKCLTQLYGDYMTLPPEEERIPRHVSDKG